MKDQTGLNKKTVRLSVSSLSELDLLSAQKRSGTSDFYMLKLGFITPTRIGTPPIPKTVGVPESVGVPKTDQTPTKIGTGGVPKTVPKPKREPKKESKKIFNGLDLSKWPELPNEQIWIDYKKLRAAKRAPISETVINTMSTSFWELSKHGVSVNQALKICCQQGWQGLKTDWVLNHLSKNSGGTVGYLTTNEKAAARAAQTERLDSSQDLEF